MERWRILLGKNLGALLFRMPGLVMLMVAALVLRAGNLLPAAVTIALCGLIVSTGVENYASILFPISHGDPRRGASGARLESGVDVVAQPRVVTAATDCRDCGVVESMRAVEKSVNHEILVRMNDGTYRTLYERAHPVLTIGQKVRVTFTPTDGGPPVPTFTPV